MPHPALAHLPAAVFALAPELATLDLPDEHRADCARCPIAAPPGQQSEVRPFKAALKCCTFHPDHPNFLVGRALRRGGIGAERIRERLRDPRGVTERGIAAPADWSVLYARVRAEGFGRREDLRCPYVDGQGGCAVWRDRGYVCRTWHCRHVDGARGRDLWDALLKALAAVEHALAYWCVTHGEPPDEASFDDPATMEAWYVDCADRLDAVRPTRPARLRDDDLDERIDRVLQAHDALRPEVPLHLGPRVHRVHRDDDGTVHLGNDSILDHEPVPGDIFQLLSRLDGTTPWPEALQAANAHVAQPYDAATIERLFRLGLLEARDPDDPDHPPGEPPDLRLGRVAMASLGPTPAED